MDKKLLNKSINNLLNNCAELNENDTLLIISEDSKFGWYDKDISIAVYDYAKNNFCQCNSMIMVLFFLLFHFKATHTLSCNENKHIS